MPNTPGEIQLMLKHSDSCTFCLRREAMFVLRSSEPDRRLVVALCKFCAEKLALSLNSIRWQAER